MIRKLKLLKNRKPQIRNTITENESEKEDGLVILRKSLFAVIKEYLENSTLAGCKRIVEPRRHLAERLIWLVVICLAICGAAHMVKLIWKDFVQNPTVVSLESDQYPVWKIPFPAIAICNVNKLSRSRIETFANSMLAYNNETSELMVSGFRNLGKLIDYNSPTLDTFEEFMRLVQGNEDIETKPMDSRMLMKMLSPSCEKMLLRCKWMGDVVDCSKFFEMRLTSEGYCCAFNYNPKSTNEGEHKNPIYSKSPGVSNGLSVVLDPHLDDYVYPIHISQGFNIHVFYTHDYPDPYIGNTVVRFIPVDNSVFVNIAARTTRSVPSVKQFSIDQRKCMLKDDLPEKYGGKYSFSDCIFKCKKQIIRALCKCTPFFMPSTKNNSCELAHLPCLYKYKDKFRTILTGLFKEHNPEEDSDEEPIDGLFCNDCYPDCAFTKYSTKVSTQPLMKNGKDSKILMHVTAKNYSLVHIFFGDVDTELYKLDVVYYWFELISNLGGICGLFIGLSLVSVFEIVYFLTIRLVDELHKNKFSFSKCFF
ncbi:sodium channel protein Nach-like [Arctopsyche grandis]|uniref:sodium channel protein Nach-like n=1 Tax=Arctopsyche grandis TaxID=121162 RepID=UPI00406D6CDF